MSDTKMQPVCELMLQVADLAEAHGRIPVGDWQIDLEPGFRLRVNGTNTKRDSLPPWHAMITNTDGFPLFLFNPYGGSVIGSDPNAEDSAIVMLARCVERAKATQKASK